MKLEIGVFITILTLAVGMTTAWNDLDNRVEDLERKVKVLKKKNLKKR